LLPPNVDLGYHRWSRDGRFLYFTPQVGNKVGVYRVPVQGGKEELVVDYPHGLFCFYTIDGSFTHYGVSFLLAPR